jgi:hypothetical protein
VPSIDLMPRLFRQNRDQGRRRFAANTTGPDSRMLVRRLFRTAGNRPIFITLHGLTLIKSVHSRYTKEATFVGQVIAGRHIGDDIP